MSDDTVDAPIFILGALALIAIGWCSWAMLRYFDTEWARTDYCSEYVAVESITPVYEDNGKHEDEQYVVTYKDGTVSGTDQGNIEPYRCTKWVELKDGETPEPHYKKSRLGKRDHNVAW